MSTAKDGAFIPAARSGIDYSVAVPLLIVHLVGIGLAPFTMTKTGFVACAVMYLITGFGVTMGAHRLFTHRSFTPSPIVRDGLALAFLMSAQGSIHRWVRDHNIHHQFSDRPGDPHSPKEHGFFAAHLGWLWKKPVSKDEARTLYTKWTKGLDIGRVGRFFQRGTRLAALHLGVIYGAYVGGAFIERGVSLQALASGWRTGLSVLVWGVLLRIVLVMHSTFFVNSATHLWGARRYETRDDSRNLWWVAVLALGEGWHNNHHGRPSAANNGFHAWWEIDLTFVLILGLGALGLIRDVKVFRPKCGGTEIWFREAEAALEVEAG